MFILKITLTLLLNSIKRNKSYNTLRIIVISNNVLIFFAQQSLACIRIQGM